MRLQHRTIGGSRRQDGCHGDRFHQLIGMLPGSGDLDPRWSPGRIVTNGIARRKRYFAKLIVDRPCAAVRGDPARGRKGSPLQAAKDHACRWHGRLARAQGDDCRRRRLRVGRWKARWDCADQCFGIVDRSSLQSLGRPGPTLVEDDEANCDAGPVFDIRAA